MSPRISFGPWQNKTHRPNRFGFLYPGSAIWREAPSEQGSRTYAQQHPDEPHGLELVNPFALVVLALVAGYLAARSLKTVISSVDRVLGGGSAAVEEGVRRALTPPPLVNYRGYMETALLDAADLSSLMVNDTANIRPGVAEFVLDLRFGPDKSDDTSSAPILIEGGVNEGDAVFDME